MPCLYNRPTRRLGLASMDQTLGALGSSGFGLGLLLIGLGLVSVLGWRRWVRQRRYQPLRSLPSPPQHWLLGHIPLLVRAVKNRLFFQLLSC